MELKEIAKTLGLPDDATEEQILAAINKNQPDKPKYIEDYDLSKLKIQEAELIKLKGRYKKLYVLDVIIDPTEAYQFIVARPSRDLIKAFKENISDSDKLNDLIEKNMIVGGDLDALEDGVVYGKVMKELGKVVNQGHAFLGKA